MNIVIMSFLKIIINVYLFKLFFIIMQKLEIVNKKLYLNYKVFPLNNQLLLLPLIEFK